MLIFFSCSANNLYTSPFDIGIPETGIRTVRKNSLTLLHFTLYLQFYYTNLLHCCANEILLISCCFISILNDYKTDCKLIVFTLWPCKKPQMKKCWFLHHAIFLFTLPSNTSFQVLPFIKFSRHLKLVTHFPGLEKISAPFGFLPPVHVRRKPKLRGWRCCLVPFHRRRQFQCQFWQIPIHYRSSLSVFTAWI